jgi:hypothetical protein
MSDPWKAVRRGLTYCACAPACGGDCTFADHEKAVANASALAKRLGPTWRPVVWENLGWHYKAVSTCGRLKVYGSRYGYTAFLGDADNPGGRWACSAPRAKAAVDAVIRQANDEREQVAALLLNLV